MEYIPVVPVNMTGTINKATIREAVRRDMHSLEFRSESMFHRPGSLLRLRDVAGDAVEVHVAGKYLATITVHPTGEQAVVS